METENKTHTRILFIVLWLFLGLTLNAQNCPKASISILVIDEDTKLPLPFARITNTHKSIIKKTDANGRVLFGEFCANQTVDIIATHFGCDTFRLTFNATKDTLISIILAHHTHELAATLITETEPHNADMLQKSVIDRREIQKKSNGNFSEALDEIAGVSLMRTGGTIQKPVIRGFHSNRIALFSNLIRLESQSWGQDHAPEMGLFGYQQLTVVKGTGALMYAADAAGGVVIAEKENLNFEQKLNGNMAMGANSNGRGGVIGLQLENSYKNQLAFRANASVRRQGNLKSPNYYLDNTGLDERTYELGVAYQNENKTFFVELLNTGYFSDFGVLSSAHIGNLTDLNNAIARGEPLEQNGFSYEIERPKQDIAHFLNSITLKKLFENHTDLSFTFGYQYNERLEFDKHRPRGSDKSVEIAEFQMRLTSYQAQINYHHHIKEKIIGNIGISTTIQNNRTTGRLFLPTYEREVYSAHVTETYQKQNFQIEYGSRYDWYSLRDFDADIEKGELQNFRFGGISNNLSLSYKPYSWFKILNTYGNSVRQPGVNELFSNGIHHGVAAYEQGNRTLKTENIYQTSLGFYYHPENRLSVGAELYYQYGRNFIYLEPQDEPILTIRGAFPAFEYNQADARIYGTDLFADFRISKFIGIKSSYEIVRTRLVSNHKFLPFIPSDGWNNTLYFNKAFSNKKISNLRLSVSADYRFEQTRTDIEDEVAPPPPPYLLLNSEVGLTIKNKKSKNEIQINLLINNLLNSEYRDYMDRLRYFAAAPGRNILLNVNIPFEISSQKTEKN